MLNFWQKNYECFKNNYFFKNSLNSYKLYKYKLFYTNTYKFKLDFWRFFNSGFYLDDLFSKFIIIFFKNSALFSLFIFDRWFSNSIGVGFTRNILYTFNSLFFIKKLNFLQYFFVIIIVFFNIIFLLFLVF
uniref:NADH dehydrogenase subunit 5 n=1 Tax=Gruberia lanceolata TaxID=1978530 RepID=A0A6C0UG49_9CILI|nr:hypothetical protein [Gruberia lanceolata]